MPTFDACFPMTKKFTVFLLINNPKCTGIVRSIIVSTQKIEVTQFLDMNEWSGLMIMASENFPWWKA